MGCPSLNGELLPFRLCPDLPKEDSALQVLTFPVSLMGISGKNQRGQLTGLLMGVFYCSLVSRPNTRHQNDGMCMSLMQPFKPVHAKSFF